MTGPTHDADRWAELNYTTAAFASHMKNKVVNLLLSVALPVYKRAGSITHSKYT